MRRSWVEYFATGRPSADYRVGNTQVQGYMQIHATQYALRSQHARTWEGIERFFRDFSHGLPEDLASDVAGFQESFVTRFDRPFQYPYMARHNLWEFVRKEEELRAGEAAYELRVTEPYDRADIEDFLNKIYFRRRAGFGKMRVRRLRSEFDEDRSDGGSPTNRQGQTSLEPLHR